MIESGSEVAPGVATATIPYSPPALAARSPGRAMVPESTSNTWALLSASESSAGLVVNGTRPGVGPSAPRAQTGR